MTTVYKIRSKSNPEMYVDGTPHYPSYNKEGRVFKIGRLRAFLTAIINGQCDKYISLSDFEIVEIEMVIREVKEVHEVIKPDKLVKMLMK